MLRLEIAAEKGLTPAQARRLVGNTREELEADADELLEAFGAKKPESKPESGDDRKPSLRVLRLLTRGGDSCSIVVATQKGMALTPEQSAALVEAVRGSAIAPPYTSDDPTGRFSHVNFPMDLDIPRTLAYIESPPPAPTSRRRRGADA